jgi:hypothetical protein
MVATLATSQNQLFKKKTFFALLLFFWQKYEIFAPIGKRNLANYWIPTPHWWTTQRKKLLGFNQFLYFAFPCNFLKFQHFKQIISRRFEILKNNLIHAEPENLQP